jgi:hypothetical protein
VLARESTCGLQMGATQYLGAGVGWGLKTNRMAAQPPIPPPPPAVVPAPVIPPPVPDPLQAALEFARATAKDEIESIKRLHDRTLLSLTILFVFLGAVGGVVGWVGYKNLRDTAVQLAQKTVKDEIEKQMTSMNVDQIIENRLNEKTGAALTFTIRDAVAAEAKKQGMSSQINQAVTAQVEELRKQLLKTQRITAQRTFTPEQAFAERCKPAVSGEAVQGKGYTVFFDRFRRVGLREPAYESAP